jgi:hypothetical protein
MVVYCCYARRRRVRRLRPIAKVVPERRPILLLLELGFVLPRVVEFVVLGRHGIVVVVDHVVRERAADGFLADGLDVRQGLADARALRREGRSGGDDARFRGRNGRTCRHGGVPGARARSPGEPARWPGPAPRTRRRDPAGAPRGTSAGTPPARAATWSRAVGSDGRNWKNGTRSGNLSFHASWAAGWFHNLSACHWDPRVAAMAYQQMRDAGAQYRKGGDPFARPAFDSYETQYDPGYDTPGYQQGGMRPPQSQQVRRSSETSRRCRGTGCRS